MEIKKKIGERILCARKNKKLTGVELAKQLNTSKQRISSWENGRRTPSLDDALALEKILDVSALYLLCVNDENTKVKTDSGLQTKIFSYIPMYSTENTEHSSKSLPVPPSLENKISSSDFAFTITDKSMEPKFKSGDIVVFRKSNTANHNDIILLELASTKQTLVRRLYIDNSNTSTHKTVLIAHSDEWPDINIHSESEFDIIGRHESHLSLYF